MHFSKISYFIVHITSLRVSLCRLQCLPCLHSVAYHVLCFLNIYLLQACFILSAHLYVTCFPINCLHYEVVIKIFVFCTMDELTVSCVFAQPNTTSWTGENYTWHVPITAHVLISLSQATRLTGVRLNLLLVVLLLWTHWKILILFSMFALETPTLYLHCYYGCSILFSYSSFFFVFYFPTKICSRFSPLETSVTEMKL